jgi:hypothetical protein
MFKSQHYRAKATEFGELVKTSTGPEESREFQKLERRFASLADNEQILADDHKSAVQASNHEQSRGAALAAEEEYVLRCLGAALIMQWNILPTTLQREVFDTAGSMGRLLETAALRGQIARFLYKHKDDSGCDNREDSQCHLHNLASMTDHITWTGYGCSPRMARNGSRRS